MINYYFYRHDSFNVCALQVISFIILSIKRIIIRNSEVRYFLFQMNKVFVLFDLFHIFDVLTFILHHPHIPVKILILSHSYYMFYREEASIERPVIMRDYLPQ